MVAGQKYDGQAADMWSCGVIIYAIVCGFLPFEDQKTSNLYKKIMNAEYTLPKFLSEDAKDILSKIFVTDPNKRIDVEGLKQHPWYKLHQPENANYNFHTKARTVNDKLVLKMEASLGFSTESVQRAVENNKHNHSIVLFDLSTDETKIFVSPTFEDAFTGQEVDTVEWLQVKQHCILRCDV